MYSSQKLNKNIIYISKNNNNIALTVAQIGGYHVKSNQASFASHHTSDHHVGFLLTQGGIGEHNAVRVLVQVQRCMKKNNNNNRLNFRLTSWQDLKFHPCVCADILVTWS